VSVYSALAKLIASEAGNSGTAGTLRIAVPAQAIYMVQATINGQRYVRRVPAF
jgi:hypothetical protein